MDVRERLEDALRTSDDRGRKERVERIVWVSAHSTLPTAILGRTETLALLQEARDAFVNGHYLSTLLVATCVIEHSLSEEFQLRGAGGKSESLSGLLVQAETCGLLSKEASLAIQQLVWRRNPLAHLKSEDYVHGLGHRVASEKRHPQDLVEADARSAIELMYEVFRRTLRCAV